MKKQRRQNIAKLNWILGVLGLLLLINILWIAARRAELKKRGEVAPKESVLPENIIVSRVVDGDTIKVQDGGEEKTVRLLGVNTPETVDPRKTVECYGRESSRWLKNMIEGKTVRLQADASQGDKDKYGRYLRYVWLEDNTLINAKIIEEGYGFEYTYEIPYKYWSEFRQYQNLAREEERGLWNPQACSGKK